MPRLTLQLLGGFSARYGSDPALSLGTKKAQLLIAYLAVPAGWAHPRDKLASLLWGGTGNEQARQSLRQTLVALRRALPTKSAILVVEHDTLALDPAAVEVDVGAFERLAAGTTVKALEQAVALYRGDLLEGVRVTEEPFEEWLRAERERLRERAVEALTRLLALQGKAGEIEGAVHTAARLLALDPMREAVHRTLMRLYARQGRRGDALRQYQVCVNVLQRELRAEPEAETKHLYRELLQQPRGTLNDASVRKALTRDVAGPVAEMPPSEARLIGREAELARVRQAWAAAGRGQGQVVVIAGEAGIGKSGLLRSVVVEAAQQGGRVLLGRCYESEQILPFGPWVDAFRSGHVIGDAELLAQLNASWRAELGRLFPEVVVSGGPAPTDDRLRLFEAVAHLVELLGATQPTVLGLEDLHWADEMSLRLLAFVARRIRGASVLLVATVREDEPASGEVLRLTGEELGREAHCSSLTLSALSRADTEGLVRILARRQEGDDGAAAARADQVWAISEGNPFMVVETMRALREGAMPDGSPRLALPARVREVIIRRVERLSVQGQELAAVAAVIGREFEFGLLHRSTGMGQREAAQGVEELVRRRILHGVGERFDFTHDRIREAIATGLVGPRRKVLHGQVADAIEDVSAHRLEPHATALGLHYLHAEVWDKASAYLLQAGRAAWRRSAPREAIACLDHALGALEHLPGSRATNERAVDARLVLHYALYRLADRDLGLSHLLDAERLAVDLDDQPRLGRVLAALTNVWWYLGEYDSAVDTGERAVVIGSALGDLGITTEARSPLGRAYHSLGELRRVKRVYQDHLRDLDRNARPLHDVEVPRYPYVAYRLAGTLAELGEFTEGVAVAEEVVGICRSLSNWFGLVNGLLNLGFVRLHQGEFLAASSALEEGLDLSRSREFTLLMSPTTAYLGHAYVLGGRLAEGLPLLEQSVNEAERRPIVWSQSLWSGWWAEALLLAGRIDDATAAGQRALDRAIRRKERGQEAYAQRLLGDIASQAGARDAAEAERHYRLAVSQAEELGMRPLVAHCHFALGKLCRCLGKLEARAHLATAAAMYREMDMRFWLEQAEALVSG